jgi:4-amino-4-deoxy-L-arabinose transferase-like glycosyltransferase
MSSARQNGVVAAWVSSLGGRTFVRSFMILGILLRLRQYLFDRSLWLDESLLVLNIIRRSPAQLLKPLENHQAAPLGFLLLEKSAVLSLGTSELALRLVPFLCGVASIFLFVEVARRFVDSAAVPIAAGLFAISGPLIYYSSEAKQYSSDVAVVLVLFLLTGLLHHGKLGTARLIWLSAVGGLALWFSYPSVFVLGGLGLSALWLAAKWKDRRELMKLFVPLSFWSVSLLVYSSISLHRLTQNQDLRGYWHNAFMPLPPSSLGEVHWFLDSFFEIFSNPLGLPLVGIAATATILGGRKMLADHSEHFRVLVIPIALALLASGLRLYPFQGRLLLFIVPSVVLLIAAGLDDIRTKTGDVLPLLGPLLIGLLFLQPLYVAAQDFVKPQGVEETRPVLEYVEKHHAHDDFFYIYYSSQYALDYYRERGVIAPMDQTIGVESRGSWKLYREDLDKLVGRQRVWLIFSHIWRGEGADEQKIFLDHLNDIGRKLDEVQATGASAYLYDLSPAADALPKLPMPVPNISKQ